MFGIPKKWLTGGVRAVAGLGAATTLLGSGLPAVVKDNTNLTKQYGDYSKEVRLPETRRGIDRSVRSGARINNAYRFAGAQQIDRKDLKDLKKK
ncbi:hypothetical protein [Arthrobacter sp. AZCC_0090]|uniref:hypothetical protein n=1 Tax=Arthrobacter sp. AZCC_0090 TaxID=2735881 RepID=UPI00160C264F|nr:hypothetical protein [Arthrobacter sp. AZCC_0090]MBB6406192.1 hypothetical protein [Arthrobacter sp. AZCC_0090]